MKFAIVGATGGSGLCLVRQALDEGHEVTAIVRNTAKLKDIQHENFKVIEGDVFSAESLQPHFEGCDAVFSCLGSPTLVYSTTIYSAPMKAIVTAMRGVQVKRIIIMSSWYVKVDPDDDPGFKVRWVVRTILSKPLADLAVMEQFLEEECQDIDFTVVKPPQLIDGPSTACQRILEANVPPEFQNGFAPLPRLIDKPSSGKEIIVEVGRHFCDTKNINMPRADVARFMLENVHTVLKTTTRNMSPSIGLQ